MTSKDMSSECYPWPAEYQLDAHGKYLRRRPAHFRWHARNLVAHTLYRAAVPMLGELASPCQSMAGVRLLTLLQESDPEMLQLVMDDHDRCMTGFARIYNDILSNPSPIWQNLVKGVNLHR